MRNFFKREQPMKSRQVQQFAPKKKSCKIKFKQTKDGETIEFDNCSPEQIEMAKQMREEKGREKEDY